MPALVVGIGEICTHIMPQAQGASFKMLLQGVTVKKTTQQQPTKILHLEFEVTANSYHSGHSKKAMLGSCALKRGGAFSISLLRKSWSYLTSRQIYFHGGGGGEGK